MANVNGVAGDRLKSIIDKIETLEDEKREIAEQIKDVKAEAKSVGFDVKVINQIIRERKMRPHERIEFEALLEIYRAAIGMLDGTPLGNFARKKMMGIDPASDQTDIEDQGGELPPDDLDADKGADSPEAARAEGADAASNGVKITANPYRYNDKRRAAWDEGWCAASGSDGMEVPPAWRRSSEAKKPGKDGKA